MVISLSDEEKEINYCRLSRITKFIKKLLVSEEFLHGKQRWCLWISNKERMKLKNFPY
jgi:hypothetical protein